MYTSATAVEKEEISSFCESLLDEVFHMWEQHVLVTGKKKRRK